MWFGGKDLRTTGVLWTLAVDPKTYLDVSSEISLAPEQKEAWLRRAQGAMWAMCSQQAPLEGGTRVTLQSSIFPSPELDFSSRDLRAAGQVGRRSSFFFHYDYLNDAPASAARSMGWLVSRV